MHIYLSAFFSGSPPPSCGCRYGIQSETRTRDGSLRGCSRTSYLTRRMAKEELEAGFPGRCVANTGLSCEKSIERWTQRLAVRLGLCSSPPAVWCLAMFRGLTLSNYRDNAVTIATSRPELATRSIAIINLHTFPTCTPCGSRRGRNLENTTAKPSEIHKEQGKTFFVSRQLFSLVLSYPSKPAPIFPSSSSSSCCCFLEHYTATAVDYIEGKRSFSIFGLNCRWCFSACDSTHAAPIASVERKTRAANEYIPYSSTAVLDPARPSVFPSYQKRDLGGIRGWGSVARPAQPSGK